MQVRRWDPFTVLARVDDQLSREFDALVQRAWGASGAGFVPPVEVVRDGEDVVVRLELPGIDPERDVAIEVERGKLVISGERREPHADQAGQAEMTEQGERPARAVLLREWRYGSFRREFALPQGISPEQVDAAYDSGVLDVRVRAVSPERRAVRVPVAVGARQEPQVVEGSLGGAEAQRAVTAAPGADQPETSAASGAREPERTA